MGMAGLTNQPPTHQTFMVGGRRGRHRSNNGSCGGRANDKNAKTAKEMTDARRRIYILGGLLF